MRGGRDAARRGLTAAAALLLVAAPSPARAAPPRPTAPAAGDDPAAAPAAPRAGAAPARSAPARSMDVEAAQAILAVQGLDGWLLAQSGDRNSVAAELVAPTGAPQHPWFYFVPAMGEPALVVHQADVAAFEGKAGRRVEYADQRELRTGLRGVLKGSRKVAMEYAPRSRIPTLTRVDAATVGLVRGFGVKVSSSAELVQFTKSLWGPDGRVAHYVAIHHLARLKDAALAYLGAELRARRKVTELDLQRFLQRGFEVRGLEGPPPIIAAGEDTADPRYAPGAGRAAVIQRGDLLLIDLSARVADAPRPIYARLAWVAYVGDAVPARYADTFRAVASSRDATVKFVEDRIARKRVVKGFEADRAARSVLVEARLGDKFIHRTGHSLDTNLFGDGANLDDRDSHDTRNLVMGSGFTIGPGVYQRGDFGMRSIVDVYIARKGLEVTSPAQQTITPVLAP
ncbi:MAG TPA: M24 family metallopeptidase [Kofleriaceae bacterium]|nr:M24 family metallopeptidase [Kofleriaceae bacterium]